MELAAVTNFLGRFLQKIVYMLMGLRLQPRLGFNPLRDLNGGV